MLSMTGYGKGIAEKEGIMVAVELRAVNHRFLDLSFKLPKSYVGFQEVIRQQISSTIKRGHIDIFLEVRDNREGLFTVELNSGLANAYINAAKQLNTLGVPNDLSASTLLRLPDIVSVSKAEEGEQELAECIEKACAAAIEQLNAMRLQEGEKLKENIKQMLAHAKKLLAKVKAIAPSVPTIYAKKLEDLIKEYTASIEIDSARLMTEVALYADKCSIDEEITRLESHFAHLDKILKDGKEAGRQLDFLVQECNREVNTIGSKSNSLEITKNVLLMKNEIEKIREQAQNVE